MALGGGGTAGWVRRVASEFNGAESPPRAVVQLGKPRSLDVLRRRQLLRGVCVAVGNGAAAWLTSLVVNLGSLTRGFQPLWGLRISDQK